ncbi:MAG: lysophospholipid acyltransferase family protein [Bacteroidota bacterium]
MSWSILACLYIVGARPRYDYQIKEIPKKRPVIIVSNHQSMFDIPTINWGLRRTHPKFISKASLAKGIPSVSYSVRNGGSIHIDRKDPVASKEKIRAFGRHLTTYQRGGCIFAEGTRSKDGKVAPFKKGGLFTLLDEMPDAVIIPVALENYWKINRYGFKPIPFGAGTKCTILPAFEYKGMTKAEVLARCETQIRQVAERDLHS